MKLNRDYIIGAFIGGAAVSIIGGTRLASTSKDLESRRKALKEAIATSSDKDQTIELYKQQATLDEEIIANLVSANERVKKVLLVVKDRYDAFWNLRIAETGLEQVLWQKYGILMNDTYGYWNMAEVYDLLGFPYPWTSEGKTFQRERSKRYVL